MQHDRALKAKMDHFNVVAGNLLEKADQFKNISNNFQKDQL